jgi:hypothetical protein
MIPVFPEVQFTRDNSWINNWQPRVSTEAVTNVLISTTPAFTVVSGAS